MAYIQTNFTPNTETSSSHTFSKSFHPSQAQPTAENSPETVQFTTISSLRSPKDFETIIKEIKSNKNVKAACQVAQTRQGGKSVIEIRLPFELYHQIFGN